MCPLRQRCLPLWGKWIEIHHDKKYLAQVKVSSPVGEVD